MWTATELAYEARPLGGTPWRIVEDQYHASTLKLAKTAEDQAILEQILEDSKPAYPLDTEHLHYLLKTPFRYRPAYPYGSRFRRAAQAQGVFYASRDKRTALAETAYYRLRFFAASHHTPWPSCEHRLTAFSVRFRTDRGLDLTTGALARDRALWTHPSDYTATQALADCARDAGIETIRYLSVRDPKQQLNVALMTPSVFILPQPVRQESWLMYIGSTEVTCYQPGTPPRQGIRFAVEDLDRSDAQKSPT
ncbi:MAG: RES family NAD+ phosphorylase [Pseudomonadota bacterium]|nr:RES family NAD+ phosphorylase [Pseudomonadota bacterium]